MSAFLSGLLGVLVGAGIVWQRERAMEKARLEATLRHAEELWNTPAPSSWGASHEAWRRRQP